MDKKRQMKRDKSDKWNNSITDQITVEQGKWFQKVFSSGNVKICNGWHYRVKLDNKHSDLGWEKLLQLRSLVNLMAGHLVDYWESVSCQHGLQ